MACMLKISEAVSLAFHSAAYLASNNDRLVSTKEISTKLGISDNHLSKVMQRLVNAGVVKSIRGPKGGFQLNVARSKITLMDIYKSIQGPLVLSDCLLNRSECLGRECILGDLVAKVNKEVSSFLNKTKLSKFTDICQGEN